MIKQDCYGYIEIGFNIRLLRNINSSSQKEIVKTSIEKLLKKLEENNFVVSLSGTKSSVFQKMVRDINALTDMAALGAALSKDVIREFGTVEDIVFAEACTKYIYVIPTRRFNSEYLMSKPAKLLKDGSFDKLGEIAIYDFKSSCRCLLYGEGTACAFHILRATEDVLKTYYHHHVKQKRLVKPMWGNMLTALQAKTKSKPPAILLTELDFIRTAYRNPTQHPEAIYDIDVAQDLFGVCLDVIGKMAEEL